jgi:hypothetical protein
MTSKTTDFDAVGPTAVWTAYLRSFSNIAYAFELYQELCLIELWARIRRTA